jgi:hypothetical protein
MGLGEYLSALEDVTPGTPIPKAVSSTRLNAIMGAIRALARGENIQSGYGVLLSRNATGGVVINSAARAMAGGGGGGTSVNLPFDVTFSSGTDVSNATATIRPGTLNGLLPASILTTTVLNKTGTHYLVLTGTAANGQINSCSVAFASSPPAPMPVLLGQPPTSFSYLIGMAVGDGSALTWYRTAGSGSLFADGSEVFRVPKTTPAPGTLPYDIYWTWVIHS